MKVVAKRCAADATLQGVPVEELEGVVVDIEEAIVDELNVVAARLAEEVMVDHSKNLRDTQRLHVMDVPELGHGRS